MRSISRFAISFAFSQLLNLLSKGLGTSTDADAHDYFGDMEKHMVPFASTQEGDLELAFSKRRPTIERIGCAISSLSLKSSTG
jgi:hypothetical protein